MKMGKMALGPIYEVACTRERNFLRMCVRHCV